MAKFTERAEAGTRIPMTAEDRANFKGIARHPLARRWMLKRLEEAADTVVNAESVQQRNRAELELTRVRGELRRCGLKLGNQ